MPNAAHEAAFRAFAAEFVDDGNGSRHRFDPLDFRQYLAGLHQRALPRGAWTFPHTPEQTFWLVEGDQMVGTSRLRLDLNGASLYYEGHIGYDVRPSRRQEGVGTDLLRRTCLAALQRGQADVIVTAQAANIASCRTVERCGGVLLEIVPDRQGAALCRYRISSGLRQSERRTEKDGNADAAAATI